MAAYALHRSLTPLGNYLRRMKAKLGPQAATMATAHKIAVIFYTMIKNQVEYDETIWDARDAEREKKLKAKLKRQAKQLGFQLVPIEPQAAQSGAVPWKPRDFTPTTAQLSGLPTICQEGAWHNARSTSWDIIEDSLRG